MIKGDKQWRRLTMVLYVPSAGSEPVRVEQYLINGWYTSCGYSGCDCPQFTMDVPRGWHPDPTWNECATKYCCGGHGGCSYCIMTQSQAVADYQTEVTFVSNPIGAQIFIDGIEWWPGAVTTADGATFRGMPPAIDPTLHMYELRMAGYRGATGTFELTLDTPITITGNLVPLGTRATEIVPDVTTCTAPCDVNVEVTWTNDATIDMEFTPSLMIDGVPIDPSPYPPEILPAGESVVHTFLVSGLTAASHQICANPDSGTTCVTITVLTPANIVATTIVPSIDTCTTICDLTVDITWTNNGQSAGTFIPTITVNNVPTSLAPENLNFGQSVTKTFSLTGLTAGTYNICADPNTLPCATVTVLTLANIVATTIVPSVDTCTAPCDLTVDITWTNNGQSAGTFIPTITVNNVPTSLAPENLNFGQSVTKTFSLTGLTAGTYNICADPNTLPCATVTVLTLANIVATTIVPSVDTCTAPCDLTVDITWTNNGQSAGTFIPTIMVNDIPTSLTPEILGPGLSVTHTFPLTDLTVGSHTICANPNTGATCATITVNPAGGGAAMLFGLVGIAVLGMMMTSKKR